MQTEQFKDMTYQEQAHEIITSQSEQVKKMPLHKFRGKKIAVDPKGVLGKSEGVCSYYAIYYTDFRLVLELFTQLSVDIK